MRLQVEIGDDIQEYELDDNEVVIGSSESCDICLAFEGVDDQHLRLISKNDDVFATILTNRFPTLVNDVPVEVGKAFEFSSFFPIEIGGIFITKLDEVTEVQTQSLDEATAIITPDFLNQLNETSDEADSIEYVEEDDDLPPDLPPVPGINSLDEETLDEEILGDEEELAADDFISDEEKIAQEIKAKFESEKKVDREKYKPEIFVPSGITSKPQIGEITQNRVITRGTSSKKSKTKKSKKRKRANPSAKRGTSLITPKGLFILCFTLFLFSFIYYFRYYKVNKLAEFKKSQIAAAVKQKIKFSPITDKNIKRFSKRYTEVLNLGLCTTPKLKVICDEYAPEQTRSEFEGYSIKGDTLILFTDQNALFQMFVKRQLPIKEDVAEELLDANYKGILTKESFLTNKSLSLLVEDDDLYVRYQPLLTTSLELFRNDRLEFMKENKLKYIEIVSLETTNDETTFDFKGYLRTDLDNYSFLIDGNFYRKRLSDLFSSRLFTNQEGFLQQLGDSHLFDFNKIELAKYTKQKFLDQYTKYIDKIKCLTEEEKVLCSELATLYGLKSHDGASILKDTIYLVVNNNEIKSKFELSNHPDVLRSERKDYIGIFRKYNSKSNYRKFVKSNYIDYDLPWPKFQLSLSLIPLLNTEILTKYKEFEDLSINKLITIGYNSDDNGGRYLSALSIINLNKLNMTTIESTKEALPYFWRSRINVLEPLIDNETEYAIGF